VKAQRSLIAEKLQDDTSEFNKYDLRNAFDLVLGDEKILEQKLKDIIVKRLEVEFDPLLVRPRLRDEDYNALWYFNFNERVFE